MWLILLLIFILICCAGIYGSAEDIIYYKEDKNSYAKFYHDYLISCEIIKLKPTSAELVYYSTNFFFNKGFDYNDEYAKKRGLIIPFVERTGVRYSDKPFSGASKIYLKRPIRMKDYPISSMELFPIYICRLTLMNMREGNQLSLFSNAEIKILKSKGYNIEVFGSAYNTRLCYFGSLYAEDEPLGRIGDAEEILTAILEGKTIRWRNKIVKTEKFIVSPPSGRTIIKKVIDYCLSILSAHRIKLILALPASNKDIGEVKSSPYCKKMIHKTVGYCVTSGRIADLSGAPWIDFHMRSTH